MEYSKVEELVRKAGFTCFGPLNPETIELKEEVRQMCAACGRYGKCWSCPPGCGTLEECTERLVGYKKGILLQTVGQLEDAFDGEGMMEAQEIHKERFRALRDSLQDHGVLALGAGCCTVCANCTYPEAPCRFPGKMISSMEAYGMVVTEVCRANGMDYNHGPNTITYTSCVLF